MPHVQLLSLLLYTVCMYFLYLDMNKLLFGSLKKSFPTYLDNASTTPVNDDVLNEMLPYFNEKFGNPSASNLHSSDPKSAIDQARTEVSKLLNCNNDQIIFY